jgi:hypothetical protein
MFPDLHGDSSESTSPVELEPTVFIALRMPERTFSDGAAAMIPDQGELNIYPTPVHAERADDFEAWLRSTLFAAVAQVRPDLAPLSQTWRSDATEGLVYFAFLLKEDEPGSWQNDPLLRDALGDAATEDAWRQATSWSWHRRSGGVPPTHLSFAS